MYYVQLAPVNNTMWTLRAGRMRSSQGVWRAGRRAVSYAGRGRPACTGPGTMRRLLHSGHTSAPPCPVMDTPTRIQKLYPETGTVGEVYWWINKHNQNQVGREDGRDILNLCLPRYEVTVDQLTHTKSVRMSEYIHAVSCNMQEYMARARRPIRSTARCS